MDVHRRSPREETNGFIGICFKGDTYTLEENALPKVFGTK